MEHINNDIRKEFKLEDDEEFKKAMFYYALIIRAKAKQRYSQYYECECGKLVSKIQKNYHSNTSYHKKRVST